MSRPGDTPEYGSPLFYDILWNMKLEPVDDEESEFAYEDQEEEIDWLNLPAPNTERSSDSGYFSPNLYEPFTLSPPYQQLDNLNPEQSPSPPQQQILDAPSPPLSPEQQFLEFPSPYSPPEPQLDMEAWDNDGFNDILFILMDQIGC